MGAVGKEPQLEPPHEVPLADVAPALLERFIYHLVHEFVPLGVVGFALQRAQSERGPLPPGPGLDFANRTARELAYVQTPVSE